MTLEKALDVIWAAALLCRWKKRQRQNGARKRKGSMNVKGLFLFMLKMM